LEGEGQKRKPLNKFKEKRIDKCKTKGGEKEALWI